MARRGADHRWFALRRASLLAMVLALIGTVAGVVAIQALERDQESRLLKERTAELGLVLSQAATVIPDRLKAHGAVLAATQLSPTAYQRTAASDVAASQGRAAFAWLRPQAAGFVVVAAQGEGLRVGELISDERATALRAAMTTDKVVPSDVTGPKRLLGFALGAPAAPRGTVLYQQTTLGSAVSPPRASSTSPFADVAVALYSRAPEQREQVIASTTKDLPLRGTVQRQLLPIGGTSWLLTVKATRPLAGDVAARAALLVLLTGLLASALITTLVEIAGRRRDGAVALYETERESAEVFQRSLLPRLPQVPQLDLAARYVASAQGQQIGGDWFDVFPVSGGRVGFVIGDVMGHDLAAASEMAQVRSALRAYALDGACPAEVLDQLDRFVTALEVTELVTVVFGLLDPADAHGARRLQWSNAGHLPPLLRAPDGTTTSLAGGESVLIGAPMTATRVPAETVLLPGSTLLLFTDGLVEVPGSSLDEAVDRIARAVAGLGDLGADALCEHLLTTVPLGSEHDDIALLAISLALPSAVQRDEALEGAATD